VSKSSLREAGRPRPRSFSLYEISGRGGAQLVNRSRDDFRAGARLAVIKTFLYSSLRRPHLLRMERILPLGALRSYLGTRIRSFETGARRPSLSTKVGIYYIVRFLGAISSHD